MFIRNKYYKWYYQIINRARIRGCPNNYYEKHHVVPRCMGGADSEWNLVKLTFREHYLAHWLLTKFVKVGNDLRKVNHALGMMLCSGRYTSGRVIPSRWYEISKQALRRAGHSEETKLKISVSHTGKKKHNKDSKRKIGEASRIRNLGYKQSEEHGKKTALGLKNKSKTEKHRLNMSLSRKGKHLGRKHSEETKKIMREKRKLQILTKETRVKMSLSKKNDKKILDRLLVSSLSRRKIFVDYLGNMLSISQAVYAAGGIVSADTAARRVKNGWPDREAVEMPVGSRRSQCPSLQLS